MGAYKYTKDRKVYLDFTDIRLPSWKIHEVQKASHRKRRELRRNGDKFAKTGGSRLKYETPEQLKAACDAYFKAQECYVYDTFGKPIKNVDTGEYVKGTKPLTISGLALHLGMQTKAIHEYRGKAQQGRINPEYADVVTEALQRVEAYAEGRTYDRDGTNGGVFVLRHGFKWVNPIEQAQIDKIRVENEIFLQRAKMEKEKLLMSQELHRLKLKLIEAGLEADDDDGGEIHITIRRAGEDLDE